MAFANLRAARQAKESKSYLKPMNVPAVLDVDSALDNLDPQNYAHTLEGLPAYHALPSSMEIQLSDISGRGIWAKDSFRPGQILLSITPRISVLSTQYLDSYCSHCTRPASESGLKRCTKCRVVWYCDATCQHKDWPSHQEECTALQRWARSAPSAELAIPSDAVRCLGRLLWKRQKEGKNSVWAREISSMQSNRASIHSSAYESYTHLAHSLVRYLGLSSPPDLATFGFSSAGDIVDIVSRFIINTFTLTTASLTPIGVSVSPLVALFNHSCDPNAVIVFPQSSSDPPSQEPRMQVITLRSIAPHEEVLTAYIDTTLPTALRQKALQATYNFTCHCALCIAADALEREAMWCPKLCGGVCPLPTEETSFTCCKTCKAVVLPKDTIVDVLRIGQEALDKATALQSKDHESAKRLTTKMIPILTSAGILPSSHPLLALNRLHQSLLISSLPVPLTQESLDSIIWVATKTISGLSSVLRPGHPVRGIALAELGKVLAVDEPHPDTSKPVSAFPPSGPGRLKLAYDTLKQARDELLVGFGTSNGGGLIGEEVRNYIISLEKELGVWKQGMQNLHNYN